MTKPKEKTREELTAEIEENEKKVRQYQNREKIIKQKCAFAGTIDSKEREKRNESQVFSVF